MEMRTAARGTELTKRMTMQTSHLNSSTVVQFVGRVRLVSPATVTVTVTVAVALLYLRTRATDSQLRASAAITHCDSVQMGASVTAIEFTLQNGLGEGGHIDAAIALTLAWRCVTRVELSCVVVFGVM